MTRKEHLEFCKRCVNRKMDPKQGIICGITEKIADFEESCSNYKLDENLKVAPSLDFELDSAELSQKLDAEGIGKLRKFQDFYYAIIGGALAAFISAIIWALITVATNYQIGYMAIGVGLLVGFSVQFFGAGIDNKFGILGAFYALLGCMLGNLFSQVGFIANSESMGYFEVLSYLNFPIIKELMLGSFNPMDVLFYGIAIFEGYKFAFRKISVSMLEGIISGKYNGVPANHKLRMPLSIVSILVISFCVFKVVKGESGFKKFHYESGKLMSEGEMKGSKENGLWVYYYENGKKQVEANYNNGVAEGEWKWYNENEALTKIGNYDRGIEHGLWMNFYTGGLKYDSCVYDYSRIKGGYKMWSHTGALIAEGEFKRNKKVGEWTYYFENGNISSKGEMKDDNPIGVWKTYYENGKPYLETEADEDGVVKIINEWNKYGKKLVANGNGEFKSYYDNGKVLETGKIKNGLKEGEWKSYYENGKIEGKSIWKNNKSRLVNYYNSEGRQLVENGNGFYKSYYPGTELMFEKGQVVNGLRSGSWVMYYQTTGTRLMETEYLNDEIHGKQTNYYESGEVSLIAEFSNGKKSGKCEWYYMNGNISSSVNYVDDKKHGIQKMYRELGGLAKEEEYENGKLLSEELI